MNFRMCLYDPADPNPERPIQGFSMDRSEADAWADAHLGKAGPDAEVWIYELKEVQVGTRSKKIDAPGVPVGELITTSITRVSKTPLPGPAE